MQPHEVFLHGLLAILRGVTPEESAEVATTLYRQQFRLLEVPINSPDALISIRLIRERLPPDGLIGAGMVFGAEDIAAASAAGAGLILSPHCDPQLIQMAKSAGLACIAGVATPTEAIAAIRAGADALKFFPAQQLGPASLKSLRSVLPKHVPMLPTGGIQAEHMEAYLAAGAAGFGLGQSLYKPGIQLPELSARAHAFQRAWQHSQGNN